MDRDRGQPVGALLQLYLDLDGEVRRSAHIKVGLSGEDLALAWIVAALDALVEPGAGRIKIRVAQRAVRRPPRSVGRHEGRHREARNRLAEVSAPRLPT